jgi:hypothetical protein
MSAMSYLAQIRRLRLQELLRRAGEFAARYDPALPSLVIVPGGMGSRLLRHAPGAPPYELWLDMKPVLRGELAHLAMDAETQETDGVPITPSGELSSVVKSYDGVWEFFRFRANVAGFGYDWRRAPEHEAEYLQIFLELLSSAVVEKGCQDPKPDLTLYAHSQGGLVAKLFVERLLRKGDDAGRWFSKLVTCCTPFYGTSSHISRYYVGEALANVFTGGADAVSRIGLSMEGPYILLPAPRSILEARLEALGLRRYPVRDRDSDAPVDPFNAPSRWRPEASAAFLARAAHQFAAMDREMPPHAAMRTFHFRSDIRGGPAGRDNLELSWKNIPGKSYSAENEFNPVRTNELQGGKGDGTVPWWSARLAATPPERVFDFYGVEHGGAAEHPAMLDVLWKLMRNEAVSTGPHFAPEAPSSLMLANVIAEELEAAVDPNARFATLPKDVQRRLLCIV